jgi:hypothetical protein
MTITTKHMPIVITKSIYSSPGVTVHAVELIDADLRLIQYGSGHIRQLDSLVDLFDSPGEAMLAGAELMQAEADKLAALAATAREDAARLAAAGRVSVCST